LIGFRTDTVGNIVTDTDDHGTTRRINYARRTRARQIAYIDDQTQPSDSTSKLKRLKTCGLAKAPDVLLKLHHGTVHASGLVACGSIWQCATCSTRIRARRCEEIEQVLSDHCAAGGQLGMMTLTTRHNKRDSLAQSLDRLNTAWATLQSRRAYKPLYNATAGTIATLEITYGENGWHPHLHVTLLAGTDTTRDQITDATEQLRAKWSRIANTKHDKFSIEHGLDLTWFGRESAAAARYVTKLAKEMTLTSTKNSIDPFTLLDTETPTNTALWIEYANATHGRQCHRWSNGLRGLLHTDEELSEDDDAHGLVVLVIAATHWNAISERERLGWIEFCEAQHQFSSS
jgi:hypothetical protein